MRQYYQGVKGGALPLEARTYIQRPADRELYDFLSQETIQQCCYILAPRQSGKTSLMIRIADQLQHEGYHCVTINLQGFSLGSHSQVDESLLYHSILWEISATFPAPEARKLNQNIEQRSQEMANVFPALQFRESLKYIIEYLQSRGTEQLIIFLDEIQSLISWRLQNSFLGLLRALQPEQNLKSVKFVLLGVAKPTDILTDPAIAFNTAKGIELGRLDEGDCSTLIQGLTKLNCNAKQLFQEILAWTGGKPFLTQFVCNLCIEQLDITSNEQISLALEDLLERELIDNWRSHDPLSHFQEIERWFRTGYTSVHERISALDLYQELLNNNQFYFDGSSPKQINLTISGLATKSDNYITISNLLYQQIFNAQWLEQTKSILQREHMADQHTELDNVKNEMKSILNKLCQIKNTIDSASFICNEAVMVTSNNEIEQRITLPPAKNLFQTVKDRFGDSANLKDVTFIIEEEGQLIAWTIVYVAENSALIFSGNLEGNEMNLNVHRAFLSGYKDELVELANKFIELS
ncbi:AAA-like domain-containing protein [Roseofilum casamattae]|uniref:AAA-like domain-containing protein n=1 Tax=Roseofilum casamattae BLCC-M143 TaxID=3022442 RepID=A0ABT7BXY1_9CYAN|nr:AAA-like domain-containing protein [Roseofilum casamattae]MDJ1184030.1 AAA-like domain-containing protein [Roseofilum casamattae BLCC-M143]